MSLLGYPSVFCFLYVSDGQPWPESCEEKVINSLKFCCLLGRELTQDTAQSDVFVLKTGYQSSLFVSIQLIN